MNNAPLNDNSLRQSLSPYPGMGSVTAFVPNLYAMSLEYNAMQLNVQRRLSHGLQTGFAYTYAIRRRLHRRYDPYTDQIGGKAAIKARYWGPTAENRKHNMIVNYSYDIPSFTENAFIKPIVRDWQVSGVTRLLSGAADYADLLIEQRRHPELEPVADRRHHVTVPAGRRSVHAHAGADCGEQEPAVRRSGALQRRGICDGAAERQRRQLRQHPGRHPATADLARVGHHGGAPIPGDGHGPEEQRHQVAVPGLQRVQRGAVHQHERVVHFTGANNSQNSNANTGKYVATGDAGLAAGTIAPRTMGITVRFDW